MDPSKHPMGLPPMQAEAATTAQNAAISAGDLVIIQNEPRVTDAALARTLGFARVRKIRELIRNHKDEIESFGSLAPHIGAKIGRGRPQSGFLLNEHQALLVAILSNAPNAREVRRTLIEAFVAWKRGHQSASVPSRADRYRANATRHWKLKLAEAAGQLDALGIDPCEIDMTVVVKFGRMISGRAH